MPRNALRRAAVWVANRAAGSGHHVLHRPDRMWLDIEQPTSSSNTPRWGHGAPPHPRLTAQLAARHAEFEQILARIGAYGPDLARVTRAGGDGSEPVWENEFFSGIDAASLYCFLRERRPNTYLEVGSGHSTRFAARAKSDGGLDTRIVSVDPEPRGEIDALCDEVIRSRLEDADLAAVRALVGGDIVLFDGSHRVFMNNDVTAFFLDVLPELGPDVLVGVHDITLPEDYHAENASFYWTEQYMLAMALLVGGADRISPVLPCHYVCIEPKLKATLDSTWVRMGLDGINGYGTTFWFRSRLGVSG